MMMQLHMQPPGEGCGSGSKKKRGLKEAVLAVTECDDAIVTLSSATIYTTVLQFL